MLRNEKLLKSWLALIIPLPGVTVPVPVNRFPNKLTPDVPDNMPRNPRFCTIASFLILSLMLFINKPDFSRDLT